MLPLGYSNSHSYDPYPLPNLGEGRGEGAVPHDSGKRYILDRAKMSATEQRKRPYQLQAQLSIDIHEGIAILIFTEG